ncbi:MAG: glycosyltransferase family 4 protein [Armatimonadetes bacterium]|nr:glycosyltransferase family 4 protein [Armatimonadota bacterium]
MRLRLCLLNIAYSGANPHLIRELSRRVDLDIVDVPFPKLTDLTLKLKTFHPRLAVWKRRYSRALNQAFKSYQVFKARSRLAAQGISNLPKRPDAILQIGGLFSPGRADIPYATYNDFTTALASREYPPWAEFKDIKSANRWYELETKLYQQAGRVLTLSDYTRRSIIIDYGVSESKTRTVRAGINFSSIQERTNGYDCRTILFVGYDFARKGGPTLLDAFALVREERPDAQLIIVGPQINEQPGVKCLGQITDRKQLIGLYHKASLFVMPSICEPFGFVFLEAMASKLPCIGTTCDAMPEIIENGRTGFVVPPGDQQALAEAILKLLGSRELLATMGERGRERVSKLFTWEQTAKHIVEEVEAML